MYTVEKPELGDLVHYGVKGMKWGERKARISAGHEVRKQRAQSTHGFVQKPIVRKLSNGDVLTLSPNPTSRMMQFQAYVSANLDKEIRNYASLTFTVDGKRVGDASFSKRSDDEINLMWLGVDKSARGNGYASAVFASAIEVGRRSGVKKLTLEVPGNSPDARHIYTKAGFTSTGKFEGNKRDMWGGLEHMEYKFRD